MTTDKVTYTIESDYPSMADALVNLIDEMNQNLSPLIEAKIEDHQVIATIIGDCYEIPLIEATIKTALPPELRITDTDVEIGVDGCVDA